MLLVLIAALAVIARAQPTYYYNPRATPGKPAGCDPGAFFYMVNGTARCAICQPGCACPGGLTECSGCSSGTFSAGGAAACTTCAPGTTNDRILNGGCDPLNFLTPCANARGQLGQTTCRTGPAATVTQPYVFTVNPPTLRIQVTPIAPGGAFNAAGDNVNPAVPLFLPGVAIPQNQVPGPYDIDGGPLVMRSY